MEASIGYDPSYVWRSILGTREEVRRGIKWRVGDGKDIQVWKDPWLPGASSGLVISSKPNLAVEDKTGIFAAPQCPLCQTVIPESLEHIFLRCAWTQRLWFAAPVSLRSDMIDALRPWLESLISGADPSLLQLIVMLLWAVWKQRNDVLFQNASPSIEATINMAFGVLNDWLAVQEQHEPRDTTHDEESTSDLPTWKRPAPGCFKLNIDAGWAGEHGQGYGLVIRVHEGECFFATTSFSPYRLSPLMAEAVGVRWALAEALRIDMDSVIMETDLVEVISCFVGRKCVANLETVIQDCRNLAVQFASFSIVHTKREGNRVAHALAAKASDYQNRCWWSEFPSFLNSAILADVFSVSI
ncbi:uncharacterized protein LOC130742132 [Lotus japonicus]|uniref:uncharacterized protein LOC130742132 n=1 Tax=Lotus japonicus TaxID=34305 RepID=UPI0025902D22|nr:uncharacterized protein LOC130742132 [Lotus japonicus]